MATVAFSRMWATRHIAPAHTGTGSRSRTPTAQRWSGHGTTSRGWGNDATPLPTALDRGRASGIVLGADRGAMVTRVECARLCPCSRRDMAGNLSTALPSIRTGPVAGLVGIEVGVVSGVINLDSPGLEAPVRRPRHEECYQQA